MEVPFLDVAAAHRELADELDDAYRRVVTAGRFVLGDELVAFEQEFADAEGASASVGVASGSDALTLALRALGIGPGDEVVVPSMTFIATWFSVSTVGAIPVPVDVDAATAGLEPDAAEAAITSRTAAVVPVHLHGLPVAVDAFEELGRRRGIRIVFDAAQAHGAEANGRPVGAFGDASTWSFYPAKNLGAFGDGGAVTSDDPDVVERVRSLRNYGSTRRDEHLELGANSRLDELQAAWLRVRLRHLRSWNARRARHAEGYDEALAELPLTLPTRPTRRCSSWHQYVVRTGRRDELRAHLSSRGVGTGIHYPVPPHRQPVYSGLGYDLPVADELAETSLSLPIGPQLTVDGHAQVVAAIRSFPW